MLSLASTGAPSAPADPHARTLAGTLIRVRVCELTGARSAKRPLDASSETPLAEMLSLASVTTGGVLADRVLKARTLAPERARMG